MRKFWTLTHASTFYFIPVPVYTVDPILNVLKYLAHPVSNENIFMQNTKVRES